MNFMPCLSLAYSWLMLNVYYLFFVGILLFDFFPSILVFF